MTAERTLTERDLNRALLARQLLLDRSTSPIPIERIGGVQAQYAPSSYVGLWSRLEGFERDDLTRALERRSVIQGTLMRMTIHLVSTRDYWPMTAAERARRLLVGGPRRRKELVTELGVDGTTWNGIGMWLDLVRVPPSGTWDRRSADLYALAEDWIGPSRATPEQGLELLLRRYLGAFGPASRKDIASWSGLPLAAISAALERLRLRRFRDRDGGELLDLPRAPLPDHATPSPVRFLPTWDATLLAHARRTQILPERYWPRIFHTKTPHSVRTFLVNGQVAGTWRFERGAVTISPFERLSRRTERELDEEGKRLAAFHA